MKIKRLEILGFKSFVDRVVLDFQQDITGIVGPNGCGKSNVVDAIRWGMGEQSPKNLRGKSMEDIIFGGSENRKPHGMAEVSLVFSTDDARAPAKYLGFSEIQATRRLFRDGESEYYINKTPCRLMDITELFMDTGVGARAYSIIEQGKIGFILHSKPEERRFLIEEAAGVTKFKSRKQVALKKIEVTRQNLLRLGDIVSEIRRQLNSLQRQAKKAEKFRQCREELREIDLFFAVRTHAEAEREREILTAGLEELEQRLAGAGADLESAELRLEEGRIALLEAEKSAAAAQETVFRVKGEIHGLENRLEFHRKELAGLERQDARREEERDNLQRQQTEAETEGLLLDEQRLRLAAEMATEEEEYRARAEALESQTAEELRLNGRLEQARRDLFAVLGEIAQISNVQSGATKRLEAIGEKFERNRRETALLRERHAEAAARLAALEKESASLEEKRSRMAASLETAVAEERDLGEQRKTTERRLQERRPLLSGRKSRLESLRELEASFAGYGQGVRTLLLSERFRDRFSGTVADALETAVEAEIAVEAVLGEALQFLLTPDATEAAAAVRFLRENGGGTGTFVVSPPAGSADAAAPEGALPLLSRVTIASGHRPFIEPLLAGAHLVDTLETALELGRRHPALTFVTPEGDVVRSGGIVTGGAGEGQGGGIIHKKREIRELTREVAALTEEIAELDLSRERLARETAAKEEEVRRLRGSLHQAEILKVNMEKDLQRFGEEGERILDLLAVKEGEEDQLFEERAALEKELEESGCGRELREERKVAIEQETDRLQKELEAKKRELAATREAVTAHRVKAASLKEKHEAAERSQKRIVNLLRELGERGEKIVAEETQGAAERKRLEQEIALHDERLKVFAREFAEAEAGFTAAREWYEARSTALREDEGAARGLRSGCEGLRQEAAAKRVALSEVSLRLGHLEESVRERYRVDIPAIAPSFAATDWNEAEKRERQVELQRSVEEMGEVNLTAIDEYRELEERANFLAGQKEDLEDSLRSLQQAIQKINRTTRKRFLETFQQVNAKFREVFPRLFCGGDAELRLTNEEDLLETGIDIIVRPPGKKLQNVTLLSGGEKALTALALVFSIFLIKPSPFCLLDEVDAPLDDANIGRFNDMVREMSAVSQFIMITHNKGTMAVSDTLYGITMEEPGVSKVVSVKLNQ